MARVGELANPEYLEEESSRCRSWLLPNSPGIEGHRVLRGSHNGARISAKMSAIMDFPDESRDFQEETFSSPSRLRHVYAQQKTALSDHIDSVFKMLLYQIKAQRDMRERSPQQKWTGCGYRS